MRYRFQVDQGQYKRGDGSGILSALGGLQDYLSQEREHKRMLAKDAEYSRQNKLNEDREENKERERQRDAARKDAEYNRKLHDEVQEDYFEGGATAAQARLSGAALYDAKGKRLTPTLREEMGPEQKYEQPNLSLGEPPEVLALKKPEAPSLLRSYQPETGRLAEEKLRAPEPLVPPELKTYLTGREAPTGRHVYQGAGGEVVLDPSEKDAFKQRKNEEARARLKATIERLPPDDPYRAQLVNELSLLAEMAGAGATGQQTAAVVNARGREDAQDWKAGENDEDRALRLKLEEMRAARRRMGGTDPRKAKRAADMDAAAADTSFQKFAANHGMAKELSRVQKYTMMAEELGVGNPALDTVIAGTWVKEAQGGTGVVSDGDVRFFWKKMGSIQLRTEDEVNSALNGDMGEAKRRIVLAAVQEMRNNTHRNLSRIASQGESYFKTPVGGQTAPHAPHWDRIRSAYFPWYQNRLDEAGNPIGGGAPQSAAPAPGAPRRRPAAAPGGPAPPSKEEDNAMVRKAQERLKANPNDEKAKAVLRANGFKV